MSTTEHSHDAHGIAHVSGVRTLLTVFASLIALTVVTVAVTYVDLGEMNFFVAMLIATVKATLVAFWFMHLKYDAGFNRLIFFGSFLFVLLFIGIVLIDTDQYKPTIDFSEKVLTQEKAP
jgi:cytochrome c oxidase subunit 4